MVRHKEITRKELMSLEHYAQRRGTFRKQALAHKYARQVSLGESVTLFFEDRLTLLYQIQEVLRIERITDNSAIDEELEIYRPLLPSGRNFIATFMIEFPDPDERAIQLENLVGIEDLVWMQVEGFDKSWCIADEDIERSTEIKTSAVHFMRFEISDAMVNALKNDGAELKLGVEHTAYTHSLTLEGATRESLLHDLE